MLSICQWLQQTPISVAGAIVIVDLRLVNENNLGEYPLIEAILQKRGARFELKSFGEARSRGA